MMVVSNTSPIINLAAIGRLDLLQQLYTKVVIPQAVFHEIATIGAGQPGAREVQTLSWLETKQITNHSLAISLRADLGEGEAEAIAIAMELEADLLLIDEHQGRTIATRLSLKFIGLLGILIEAKHRGLVIAIKPLLDELIAKAGFWVGSQLYAHVLQATGE